MNDELLALTASMPMKQIDVNGKPYLQRYYAGTTAKGDDLWIHRFLSSDGDRHLHSHPFNARSVVLCGGYLEETPRGVFHRNPDGLTPSEAIKFADHIGRPITVFDWHRIASVAPQTWTLFIVEPPRLPMWFFRDGEGNLEAVKASPRDWFLQYGPRK